MKNWLQQNGSLLYSIVTALLILAFYFGYAKAEINSKLDKSEAKQLIQDTVKEMLDNKADEYVKMEQVPGLKEVLESINKNLESVDKRLDRMEQRAIYGN